jgi:multiple antibiotic resistance protein
MLKGVELMAVYSFMALFPIVNPVGTAPIFLTMTSRITLREQRLLSWKVSLYAFILLVVSVLLGGVIIRFFGIRIAHVEIAGGLILFHTAWEMLNGNREAPTAESGTSLKSVPDMSFFPLTLPITAGPGCIAVAIAIGGRIAHNSLASTLEGYAGAVLGILGVALTVWLCFHFAQRVFSKLGSTGTMVVTKMSAFVLLAIGVEIFWSGLSQLILALH